MTKHLPTFPMHLATPWGNFECNNFMDFFVMCRKQLQWYLDEGESPNPAHTRADAAAYDELIALGDDETAAAFLRAKGAAREAKQPFKNNAAVIEHLKANGLWGPKP